MFVKKYINKRKRIWNWHLKTIIDVFLDLTILKKFAFFEFQIY